MNWYKVAQQDKYHYLTNCVGSTAEKINSMMNHPSHKDIDYDDFIRHVSEDEIRDIFPVYDWDGEGGLKLKDDWHVSYHSSVYDNKECYYMRHSSIEWVFASYEELPNFFEYKGYSIGDEWIFEGEVITNFYNNDVVYVETNGENWYDFEEEMRNELV